MMFYRLLQSHTIVQLRLIRSSGCWRLCVCVCDRVRAHWSCCQMWALNFTCEACCVNIQVLLFCWARKGSKTTAEQHFWDLASLSPSRTQSVIMQLTRAIAVIFLGFFASWSLQGCGGDDKEDDTQALKNMSKKWQAIHWKSVGQRFVPLKHQKPWLIVAD